jgi:hypothetical protein
MKQLLFIVLSFSLFLNEGFSQMQPKNANKNNIQQEASDTTKKQLFLIRKTDGNELYGFIISDDGREILLETKTIGKVYINKSDIKEIINTKRSVNVDSIDDESYTEFRDSGPFTTRYYFTNNALPVKKGEDYAMIHLYGPEIHFSLNDKLSFGVMSTWIASPIALASKYSLHSDGNNHVALGTILGTSGYLGIADGGVFGGLHWLTFTKGDRLKNISFSAGYGYFNDNVGLFNNSYLGPKYRYQTYDENEPYYVDSYSRTTENYSASWGIGSRTTSIIDPEQDLEYLLYGNSIYYGDRLHQKNKFQDALFLSLAGITPVGKKASFIFDALAIINQQESVLYSDHVINLSYDSTVYSYPNNNTSTPSNEEVFSRNQNYIIQKGDIDKRGSLNATLILMPSMRFNRSYNQAFQISISGVINFNKDYFSSDISSFPAPMISWLRKF